MADQPSIPSQDDRARYDALKKELMQALPKKRVIDRQLAQIEVQIYNLEASYLTDTAAHSGGNIMQGFENYLKNQNAARTRRYEVHDNDRLFSNSSLTYLKSLELMGEGDESNATNEEYVKQSTPVGALTTIAVPPATRTQEIASQPKKSKDKESNRKKRANPSASHKSADSDEDLASAVSASSRRPTKRARMAEDD